MPLYCTYFMSKKRGFSWDKFVQPANSKTDTGYLYKFPDVKDVSKFIFFLD